MTMANPITSPETHWQDSLENGQFLLQRNPRTEEVFFPPRLCDPSGDTLEWIVASGLGTIYSFTIIPQRPPAVSRNVVLIDLAEGPRMMAHIVGTSADDLHIGMAVKASIVAEDDGPLIVFHKA